MLEQHKLAWNPRIKEWVIVLGNRNLKQNFNPNGLYFSYKCYGLDTVYVVGRYVLEPASGYAAVQNPENVAKIVMLDKFNYKKHYNWLPLRAYNLANWDLKVGDHVQLTYPTTDRLGVVKSLPFPGTTYITVGHYYLSAYEEAKRLGRGEQFRIGEYSETNARRAAVIKLDTPAPLFEISRNKRYLRLQIKNRNTPSVKNWRYSQGTFVALSKRDKAQGRNLSIFMHHVKNKDIITIREHANEILHLLSKTNRGMTVYRKAVNVFDAVAEVICQCGQCGHLTENEAVRYSEDSAIKFGPCCEDEFMWSELMEDYIMSSKATWVYLSVAEYDDADSSNCATSGWIESTDNFVLFRRRWVSVEIVDELEDEYGQEDILQDYHGARRNWVEKWQDISYLPLGVELEVYASSRNSAVTAVAKACKNEVYLEKDGSLNYEHGFEVISQPFGKTEWADVGVRILDALKSKGAVAWNSPAGHGYGIHVNINRNYLTPLQEARMFMFLAAQQNREFVSVIAQRDSIYNADLEIGEIPEHSQTIKVIGGLDGDGKIRKIQGRGKYAPIKMHDDRMEIRIFQSTLNQVSFFKNLEFTWALIEWTSIRASTGTSWLHVDFLNWLSKRVRAEKDYPNLLAYLRKKSFYVIESYDDDDIDVGDDDDDDDAREYEATRRVNQWRILIPKEGRNSLQGDDSDSEEVVALPVQMLLPTDLQLLEQLAA